MAEIKQCRSCSSNQLIAVFSLGEMPLANSFLTEEQLGDREESFPLDLVFCQSCALVQLVENLPPDKLFCQYAYFSSFSETMLEHARDCVDELVQNLRLSSTSLVIEIASNDGYLLRNYLNYKIPVLGIDPAENIAEVARTRGVETLSEFFGIELANELKKQGKKANVIHAHNVLAHVPDLNSFVEGIKILLADDGVAVIEVPYLQELIDNVEFDTIYHEHIFYFSLTALKTLVERHGLTIFDVRRLAIHGGSLRLYLSQILEESEDVKSLLAQEKAKGLDQSFCFSQLQQVVQSLSRRLLGELATLKREGKTLAAYGAAAKGNVLLNYFGIGSETLEYVVDRNTFKHGFFTPGRHLPVLPVETLLERPVDYVLLLAWNFADEIISQQRTFIEKGGAFIIPLPEFRIVSE